MTAPQQRSRWADDEPRSRLSEAELGDTLFSTRQGRRFLIAIAFGGLAFVGAYLKGAHFLAAGFAPAAALVGLYLYRYHPSLYISYNWWVWMLTPFARRVIEIKSGFVLTSPILLAPYLVSLPTAFTLLRHGGKLLRRKLIPFALVIAALFYAYIVGMVSTGLQAASYGLLVWMVPVLVGFHIAVQWDIYPAVRTVMRRTIVASVLLMGVYGVYQFVHPPPWDMFWMWAVAIPELGVIAPMQFRVFATLNSPAPFAVVMMASLIVVLSQRSKTSWLALAAGATALLLTTVRTAWLAWAIGFLVFAWYVPWRSISRIVVPLIALVSLIAVVTAFTPLGDRIMARFASFGTLHDDVSMNARKSLYAAIGDRILDTPMGEGMGGTGPAATMSQGTALRNFDSGVLDIVFSLGWFGGLVYAVGLLGLVQYAFQTRAVRNDYFELALRAGALATLSILPSFNSLVGVDGLVFWGFLGFSISRYFWVEQWEEEEDERYRLEALAAIANQTAGAA